MNTLATERPSIEAPRFELRAFLARLLQAFGPAPARERSLNDERTLRRELWMLGGG